ncbi:MAG: hypothetical protein V9G42_06650 [Bacteroidia bacterium]
MKNFFGAFKTLPKGVYRLNIAASFILPLLVAMIGASLDNGDEKTFLGLLIFGIPIYWILARIALWIFAGFKEDKK